MTTIPSAASDRLADRRALLPARPAAFRVGLVIAAAFALGGLTSLGQAVLPAEVASLANSASGWAVPTAALVLLSARGYVEAAVGAALGFVAMTVGYAVVSGWRGFPYDPTDWAIVGLLAGPVVGVAAHALRRGPMPSAVGAGLLAGILVGEGVYGLTVIAATTSPVYWWAVIGLGAALVLATAVRLRAVRSVLVLVLVTAVVAAGFLLAYTALPLVFVAL
ncbi:MAG TPA: DUF6518 family protein [Agromyces sp.]